MFPELPGLLINSNVSIASCSWIVFCVGVCIEEPSLKSVRCGVRGAVLWYEELDPWPGIVGGLLNFGVEDRREVGVGRMSAGGARDLDGGGEVTGT